MDINCNMNCLNPEVDGCIEYTGPDIDAVGIKNGMMYDKLTSKLVEALLSEIQNKIELKCLFDNTCGNCEPYVTVPEAVKSIINKLCSLTADDVSYNGALYCIGNGSVSTQAIELLGRSFSYSVGTTPTGSSVTYNLTDGTKNLPSGYALGSARVTISGKLKRGKTIVKTSDSLILSVPVDNDRYPLNMDIRVNVNTPSGNVVMAKNVSISSPMAMSNTVIFDIQDYTNTDTSSLTQGKFNELVASQVCSNTSYIDMLKTMRLPSSSSFNTGGGGIESVLGALAAAIQGLYDENEALRKEIQNSTSGCGGDVPCAG